MRLFDCTTRRPTYRGERIYRVRFGNANGFNVAVSGEITHLQVAQARQW